jgi:hypothetical protein
LLADLTGLVVVATVSLEHPVPKVLRSGLETDASQHLPEVELATPEQGPRDQDRHALVCGERASRGMRNVKERVPGEGQLPRQEPIQTPPTVER